MLTMNGIKCMVDKKKDTDQIVRMNFNIDWIIEHYAWQRSEDDDKEEVEEEDEEEEDEEEEEQEEEEEEEEVEEEEKKKKKKPEMAPMMTSVVNDEDVNDIQKRRPCEQVKIRTALWSANLGICTMPGQILFQIGSSDHTQQRHGKRNFSIVM